MKKKYLKTVNSIINSIKRVVKNKNASFLHEPYLSKQEEVYLKNCVKTNMLSSVGPYVTLFEKKLKKITKSKYVIATINGTSALHVALRSIGIHRNDEVLIPSLNFIASTNATLYCGGIPHFIDIEENTLGIDIEKLENYLKKNTKMINKACVNRKTKRKIKAIIPTHLFGHPIRIQELIVLARKFNLKIIEDAAEGIGSYYKKKHVGTFGEIGILSFNGNKSVTTGGGGAILTNDYKLAKKARHAINNSKKKDNIDLIYNDIGFNYKMTNLHAAIGCAQLEKINQILKKKRKLFNAYKKEFHKNKNIYLFVEPKNSKSNYWLNTLILKKQNKFLRNSILLTGKKNLLGLRPVWKPLPELSFLKSFPKMDIAKSKELFKKIINIPSSPHLI